MLQSFANIYKKKHEFKQEKSCSAPVELLQVRSTDFEGRKVSSSQFVVDDPKTRFKGLSAVDFSLENQQEVGFVGKPVFCQFQRNEIDFQIQKVVDNG